MLLLFCCQGSAGGAEGGGPSRGSFSDRALTARRSRSEGLDTAAGVEGEDTGGWGDGGDESDEDYGAPGGEAGQQLQQQQQQVLAGNASLAAVAAAGVLGPHSELLGHPGQQQYAGGGPGGMAGGLDYDPAAAGRGGRGVRGGRGGNRGTGRGGRGGGRGGGRRRRADEDAFYTPPGTSIAAELMRTGSGGPGGAGLTGALNSGLVPNLPHAAGPAAAGAGVLDDRPVKRRRRTLSASGGPEGQPGMRRFGGGGPEHPDGHVLSPGAQEADARALRLQAQVVREFARTEAVKAACQDPATPEHGIALRAFHRIEQIVQVGVQQAQVGHCTLFVSLGQKQ